MAQCLQEDPPNILFLMADQMRADALSCAGNKLAKTPNLDKLATDGVRFTNAFSSTPICTPARAALLTGLSPWYHGMLGYGAIAPVYGFELPRALSEAGYYTSSVGKDHFGWNKTVNHGIRHGYSQTDLYDGLPGELDDYDAWFAETNPGVDPMATGLEYNDYRGLVYGLPEYYHPTSWVGRRANDFLNAYNDSKPFFLKVSYHRPHSPYDPPKRWMEEFDKTKMPLPFISNGGWDKEYSHYYKNGLPPDMWAGNVTTETVQTSRQAYYASTAFVDESIGDILQTLEKKGLRNNTFILFTSDHGDMLGDHNLWRKGYPYYGSAHVPMLLSWPPSMEKRVGVKRGSTVDAVTEMRDVMPTLLDVAGVKVASTINGSSLLLAIQPTPPSSWREYVDLEMTIIYSLQVHWNALTDGKIKYVFRAFYPDEQLFDLTKDNKELVNLATDEAYNSTLVQWRERMVHQFEAEQRGEQWVKNGVLQRRVGTTLYSPHYPKST